jgi:hypothetical protein
MDSKYEAYMRVEDAVRDGEKAMERASSDDLALDVAKLRAMDKERPGYKFLERYRQGAQGWLQDKLNDIKTNRNASADIVNASGSMKDKLKLIFGNDDLYEWFKSAADWEMKMSRSTSTLGNSVTHRLGAEAHGDPAGDISGSMMATPSGIKHWLAEHTFGPSIERANTAAAAHVGRSLLTQGSSAIESTVEKLLHPAPLLNAGIRGVLGRSAGLLGNR